MRKMLTDMGKVERIHILLWLKQACIILTTISNKNYGIMQSIPYREERKWEKTE